jgi:hypothetical protein
MSRPVLSIFIEYYDLMKMIIKNFRKHKMMPALVIAIVLLLIAFLFTFLTVVQVISPFVYPLF